MTHPVPVAVLGAGINGLGVIRCLGRHRVPVYVFDSSTKNIAYSSRYARPVPLVHGDDAAAIVGQLLAFAERMPAKPVLLFTSDYYLELVSQARDELMRSFRLQLPDVEAVDVVADKAKFHRFALRHGLPVPASHMIRSPGDLDMLAERVRYPLLLKPVRSFQWADKDFKVVRVEDEARLTEQWHALRQTCDGILAQEIIVGPDDGHFSYVSYRTRDRGEVTSLLINKTRICPIRDGVGSFARVAEDSEMVRIGRDALRHLDYIGVGSVCFKTDIRSGKPLIHEVNGRLPQIHAVFQMCGIPLPYLMYKDMLDEPVTAPSPRCRNGRWVSLDLDIAASRGYRRAGELSLADWLSSYRQVRECPELAPDDLGPFIYFLGQLARRVQRKAARPLLGALRRLPVQR